MLALSWCSADAHEEFERCLYLGLLASRKSYTAPEVPGDPCLDRCLGSALWVGALDRSLGSVPWIGALDRVRLGAVPGGIPGSQAGARPCAPRPPGGAAPAPPAPAWRELRLRRDWRAALRADKTCHKLSVTPYNSYYMIIYWRSLWDRCTESRAAVSSIPHVAPWQRVCLAAFATTISYKWLQ